VEQVSQEEELIPKSPAPQGLGIVQDQEQTVWKPSKPLCRLVRDHRGNSASEAGEIGRGLDGIALVHAGETW
jgi:hypothetical protein